MPDRQTPLSIAQKWTAIAEEAITGKTVGIWNSEVDTRVQAFKNRLHAHYGSSIASHLKESDVYAVAAVEAMNEWHNYKQKADRVCMCGDTWEQHSQLTNHMFVDLNPL